MSHRRQRTDDDEEDNKRRKSHFIDRDVDFMDEEDDELPGEDHRHMLPWADDREDVDALQILDRPESWYKKTAIYEEEPIDVDQQDLFPSVQDPKLWMVKCAIGRERETAVCLMQKALDKGHELQIRSAIALEHLKNYIYVEADKEAQVREACKGLDVIYASTKIALVPIEEMPDVLSVGSKYLDLARDSWVRMKNGTYKGDLAKVVDVDNVRKIVTIKLIPRIDLVALANKLEGKDVKKKKAFVPPQRFMNVEEARKMNLRVERRQDRMSGDFFDNINEMKFKDGFLYKFLPMRCISNQRRHPTFDELEKFRKPNWELEEGDKTAESQPLDEETCGRISTVQVAATSTGPGGTSPLISEAVIFPSHN